MSLADLGGLAPELILTLAAFLLLFLRRYERELAIAALLGAMIALPFLPQRVFFFGAFEINGFSLAFKALFLAISFLVALGSGGTLGARREKEYYALLLLATVGMLGVASATDLITLFISFELSSLSTYALVAYTKGEERAIEAATKFFIIGAFSSAIALYGISLLYGVAGTTVIGDLAAAARQPEFALAFRAGVVLILAGFGFKITVVPFHMWAPDVYEGAPAPITALLATGSKKMGFAALFKIFLVGLLALKLEWAPLIGVLAVVTMTAGNFLALNQTSVKRLLAYSSIAQAGYILIAFPVATAYGLAGGLFHIITHSLMTAGAFLIVAALAVREGEDFAAFQGLARRAPFLALAMAVFLLSLAGIPPLAGFQSKFVLFSSAISAGLEGPSWLIWLAIAGVLNSALSLYYYARIIKAMYFEERAPEPVPAPAPTLRTNPHPPSPQISVTIAVAIAFVLTLALGVYPNPLLEGLLRAAQVVLSL